MKILIIGSGGREHALAYAAHASALVQEILVCPGNPAMASTISNLRSLPVSAEDIEGLLSTAQREAVDLTIVGPEVSLSLGIVDVFREAGLLIVGPSLAASKLETSKAFAKEMMKKAQVPTASYGEFFDVENALSFIQKSPHQKMVVKCDGLAQGKGVIVCQNKDEAINAVRALMMDKFLGENIDHLLIEEFLEGVEISAFALCDGDSFTFLGTACDHKRLRDNDLGPNTGGMGTFAPANDFSLSDERWIEERIFAPMLDQMKAHGMPFSGILFAGLMKTEDRGFQVLEFNVRLGDPETQVLLPLLDEDSIPWFLASARGQLRYHQEKVGYKTIKRQTRAAIHVVMAAFGYPGTEGVKVRSGDQIHFADSFHLKANQTLTFAGVEKRQEHLVTKGGRVLGVTALAESAEEARRSVYETIEGIHFDGAQFRRDIGARRE